MVEPLLPEAPEHLNRTGCIIKIVEGRGRCVYAERAIPRGTLLEISPVLLFEKNEYESHGKHTLLDHYTFKWPNNGRMALALGLGSLFNHNQNPNVTFSLDTKTETIRYTTVRDVGAGEELCIFYGHNLWFEPSEGMNPSVPINPEFEPRDDGWGGLLSVEDDERPGPQNPYLIGDQDQIIPEDELPFERYKLPPEEETPDSVRIVHAWVVDVPDARHINTLIKWLRQANLETPDVAHLKRIRKNQSTGLSTLLLCLAPNPADLLPTSPPPLPEFLDLPNPYILPVPASSALTLPSLALKTAIWPTMYTPKRKDEFEPWTRGKVAWAWAAMRAALDCAAEGEILDDEVPIAAHLPSDYGTTAPEALSFTAHDTRTSTRHPLRHATINAIRKLADYHSAAATCPIVVREPEQEDPTSLSQAQQLLSEPQQPEGEDGNDQATAENGSNYLLTGRTAFVTHEPCIMCSMSLLHSRVKEVFFLHPMPKTGGCGSLACLPTLKGVNHRFTICRWTDLGVLGRGDPSVGGDDVSEKRVFGVDIDLDA